ncbi:hypothetical protein Tco_0517257 [Tanacetum coccineum]
MNGVVLKISKRLSVIHITLIRLLRLTLQFKDAFLTVFNLAIGGNLRRLSAEEAWETIEDFVQCNKQWKNPTSTISDQTIANLKTQLVKNEVVRVKIPKCMAWLDDEPIRDLNTMEDKVDNSSPQSTSQVLPSFKVIFDEKKLGSS